METIFNLVWGDYQAQIRQRGAGLNFLKYQSRNLIEQYIESEEPHRYRGVVLAPWPNRIRDGRYSFENLDYVLEINETNRCNALHGLVFNIDWDMQNQSSNSISLKTTISADNKYPTELEMLTTYSLSENGLKCEVFAKNIGNNCAPYGVSIHPYLVADSATQVNDWILKMPAREYMDVDLSRLLPISVIPVTTDFDFNTGKRIGEVFIDHAFKIDKSHSKQVVSLVSPSGAGVKMTYSEYAKWIQIHTADRDGGLDSRKCMAVEPMTCPPDSYNSKIDLIDLSPGESNLMWWEISAI